MSIVTQKQLSTSKSLRRKMWMKWLIDTYELSPEEALSIINKVIELLEHMVLGSAHIVYKKKTGEVILCKATLQNYTRWFCKPYSWLQQNHTIPYWDEEQDAWRVFELGNFINWRVVP